jgi:hypothetical protein
MNIGKYILLKMKPPSLLVYVSAILLLTFAVGVYKQLTQKTTNNCEMTFMFEYPHFIVSSERNKVFNLFNQMFLLIYVNIFTTRIS